MDLCFTLAWPSCICFIYEQCIYSSVSHCKYDLKRNAKVEGRSGKIFFTFTEFRGVTEWAECGMIGLFSATPMNFGFCSAC